MYAELRRHGKAWYALCFGSDFNHDKESHHDGCIEERKVAEQSGDAMQR